MSEYLPYSPSLRQVLGSYGASLLLIYLEREWDRSQDSCYIDIGRTLEHFRVSRGRLMGHLWMIAVGWRSQRQHRIARLAGREFLTKCTRGAGAYKPYCYVRIDTNTIQAFRNRPRLRQLLGQAGLIAPEMCGVVSSEEHSFQSLFSDFDAQTYVNELWVQVLQPLDDGRRRPGITRKPHHRRAWTAERRAKYAETMRRKRDEARACTD